MNHWTRLLGKLIREKFCLRIFFPSTKQSTSMWSFFSVNTTGKKSNAYCEHVTSLKHSPSPPYQWQNVSKQICTSISTLCVSKRLSLLNQTLCDLHLRWPKNSSHSLNLSLVIESFLMFFVICWHTSTCLRNPNRKLFALDAETNSKNIARQCVKVAEREIVKRTIRLMRRIHENWNWNSQVSRWLETNCSKYFPSYNSLKLFVSSRERIVLISEWSLIRQNF